MRINKLQKFADNKVSKNVIESDKPIYHEIKGNWNKFFENDHEIIVELACGWGEYTLALAEKFPQKNFVGVDLKGDRVWRGSQYALKNQLDNVAFLRLHIEQIIHCFAENEVAEFWLTFPDPRPKDRDEKHRLTNSFFLNIYSQLLKPEGWFRFKTDNTHLFEYSIEKLEEQRVKDLSITFDLYHSEYLQEHHGIKTKYENIWTNKGEKIKYLKCRFS